jgi:hypothetical protein
MHGRVFDSLPWTLQITAKMGGDLAQALLPVDVTDFLMHALRVKEDLASVITLALFKEPAATAAFMRTCQARMSDPKVSPQEVVADLTSLLHSVEQNDSEMEVLGAQGVARCTGLASTCRAYFRIIDKIPKTCQSDPKRGKRQKTAKGEPKTGKQQKLRQEQKKTGKRQNIAKGKSKITEQELDEKDPAASQDSRTPTLIVLGKTRVQYKPTDEVDSVARFLQACRGQQDSWKKVWDVKDVAGVAEAVGKVTKAMHVEARVFPTSVGYVRQFIDRKLILLVLAAGSACPRGWHGTSAASFTSLLPDQHAFTSGIPKTWTAAEMSNFLFGRDDWAVFASMWACLWHEVYEKYATQLEHIESFLAGGTSSPFAQRARALASKLGHNGTPCMIIDELMKDT